MPEASAGELMRLARLSSPAYVECSELHPILGPDAHGVVGAEQAWHFVVVEALRAVKHRRW